jgi:hypothetical protein
MLFFGYYASHTNPQSDRNMTKTLTINIPARSVQLRSGVKRFAAYVEVLTQDEAGQWYADLCGEAVKISEGEAIDCCRKGSNWAAIKSTHFPMFGFHS